MLLWTYSNLKCIHKYQLTQIIPPIVQPAIWLMLGRDKSYKKGNNLCQLVTIL